MNQNRIDFEFNRIVLHLGNPLDWPRAELITGEVEVISPGSFGMALSTQNLNRIWKLFPAQQAPVIGKGRQFVDRLRNSLSAYKTQREVVKSIREMERYPVEPNGKFFPYAHQTKIIGVLVEGINHPVFSGCGTGKTGASARAIEILLHQGKVQPGKILISAPLSILHTSWADDVKRFTSLRTTFLWTPESNEKVLGEERVVLDDYGPKPENVAAVKKRDAARYKHRHTGQVTDKVRALDGPKENWQKYQARWKVACFLDGTEQPFGPLIGRTSLTLNTREQFIRDQLARTDVDVFLINHDGVRVYKDILKEFGFEWVIVDESTKIKNPSSAVSHAHVDLSWKAKRRNILTGTPNPNGNVDLWHQYYFLDRGLTFEPRLKDFLREYFVPVPIGFANGPGGEKKGKAKVKWEMQSTEKRDQLLDRARSVGIFIEQRDCIDLPPRTDLKRIIYMTPEQEQAYDRMAEELVAELKDRKSQKTMQADAVNILAKNMKLRQITSGFLANRDGEVASLQNNPKLEEFDAVLDELGDKKCVVAAQFSEEIKAILERYPAHNAQAVKGGIPLEKRTETIYAFQNTEFGTGGCDLIVLQPQAAAHGITLTKASYFVYYSLDYNFEYYYQVAKRVERLGQKEKIFVIHLLCRYSDGTHTIDEDLYDILQRKSKDHNLLFDGEDEAAIANELTDKLIERVEKRNAART